MSPSLVTCTWEIIGHMPYISGHLGAFHQHLPCYLDVLSPAVFHPHVGHVPPFFSDGFLHKNGKLSNSVDKAGQ